MKNYHNYIPHSVTPKTIGIIGGRGAMGQLLAREFAKDGYKVLLTGENPESNIMGRPLIRLNRKLIQESDVVIFALPVHIIGNGIHKMLGNNLCRGLRDKLFMDVTSTKVQPMREMSKIPGATVIGTHPMFGPSVKDFTGLNVFITPLRRNHHILDARLEKWLEWIETFWKKRGAMIRHVSAEEHDRITPNVQGGVVMSVMLFMAALHASRADLRLIREIGTPNSTLLTALIGRMIRYSNLEVYLNILMENQNNVAFAESLAETAHDLATMVKNGDRIGVAEALRKLCECQPDDFQQAGLDLTNFVQRAIARRHDVEEWLE